MPTIKLEQLVDLVYHFPDRASKWLFDMPDNLRELLELMDVAFVDRLDFSRMTSANIVRVLKDFRERSADRLFEIPFLFSEDEKRPEGQPNEVRVYVLMESKSSPDPRVGPQMVCIQGAIFHQQLVASDKEKDGVGAPLTPIVPVVFYTGRERWTIPISVTTLMDCPRPLEPLQLAQHALVLDLKGNPPESLADAQSPFAGVLRTWQKDDEPADVYLGALQDAVELLHGCLPPDSLRLENLLYYLLALTAHRRRPEEGEEALALVAEAEPDVNRREERAQMGKTWFEAVKEEGRQEGWREGQQQGVQGGLTKGKQDDIVRILQHRFGSVSPAIIDKLSGVSDIAKLDVLVDEALDVQKPEELHI